MGGRGSAAAVKPRALVVGGSIGGLSAGLLLADAGFDVSVYERSAAELAGRGAGIVAHEMSLRYLTTRMGTGLDEISISSRLLRYLDAAGRLSHVEPSGYRFTSWQVLHGRLAAALPPGSLRPGRALLGFEQDRGGVLARFTGGEAERGEVLICADGISSTARQQLLPDIAPGYAGYVGWRGTAGPEALGSDLFDRLGWDITYQLLTSGHVLAYPIPGRLAGQVTAGAGPSDAGAGPRAAGERCVNWVWYRNVPAGPPLEAVMTDRHGTRRALSVPPGAVAADPVAEMRHAARRDLAPDLAKLVLRTDQPFVQCIVDVEVPWMACGRVCLIGDAAFAARPHAAAGTAKAAADAWALAGALAGGGGDLAGILGTWQQGQLLLGRQVVARSRALGDSAQLQSSWRPGDPDLLFGLWQPGDSRFAAAGTT
jgi:2,6-dihydroxypyridine 3-monooxygenase